MINLSITLKRIYCLLAIVVLQLTLSGFAMAAPRDQPEPDPPGSFWGGYAIVILAIGLGLSVVCRPGKRDKDARLV